MGRRRVARTPTAPNTRLFRRVLLESGDRSDPKRYTHAMPAQKRAGRAAREVIFAGTHHYESGRDPVHAYLIGLGEDSQRTTRAALDSVADVLSEGRVDAGSMAWHELRHGEVNALRGRLQKLYAPSTANRYLSALKAVLREAWRLHWIDRETLERTLDVKPIKGSRDLSGRAVSRDELAALFRMCGEDPNEALGIRDAALLSVLYGAGLRRSEVAGLSIADFKAGDASLRVRGKGNKQRVSYLPAGSVRAIERWLSLRGSREGALFCSVTKGGRLSYRDLSPQTVYDVVRKRHLGAGIAEFTPHDLRRSHISDLLDQGADIAVIARQVGHSNVQTTARYDRRDRRAQRDAARKLDVPTK